MSVCAQTQPETGVAITAPPEWVKPETIGPPGPWQENSTGQDFLLLDLQTNVATGETYYHRAFQVVSEEGRRNGAQINVSFDPSYQTLALHHLRLLRTDQVLDKLDLANVQILRQERDLDRQLYNGERSALVILQDVRIGDVVDLAFTLKGRNPVFAGTYVDLFALGWGVPVHELRCRVLTRADRAIAFQVRGDPGPKFAETRTGGDRDLLWVARDLPAIEAEAKTPAGQVVYPYLELTEFPSWAAVVSWAAPLYQVAPAAGPLVREVAQRIEASAPSAEAKAVAALRFVQEEVRYLGMEMGPGSHRPSDPEEVLQRRFGDCKDKARLLTALLQQLGLHAAPALVHSSHRATVRNWLPSPYAFDHVIVALDTGMKRYLLDPTLAYQRGDTLALRHVGEYGPYLRLAAGTVGLEEADFDAESATKTSIKEAFDVPAFDQPASLTVASSYAGDSANGIRAYFALRSREQIGREYLDYYTRYYPGIATDRPVEFHDDPARNAVEVTEHYRINSLFAKSATGPALQAEFYPAVISDYVRTPNLGQRKQPYAMAYPVHIDYEATIHLPIEWKIEQARQTIRDDAFVLRTSTYSLRQGRTIVLNYEWTARARAVPVGRMTEFIARTKQARESLGYTLTYNPNAPRKSDYPLNWPMVALSAAVLAVGGYVTRRLVRLPNPEPPPIPPATTGPEDPFGDRARAAADLEGLGGWLVLVGFGLILRPLVLLFRLAPLHRAYFNRDSWLQLTTPESSAYQANYALVLPLELGLNLVLLVASALLLTLYFRRSHLFPRAMQLFLGFQILMAIFSVWTGTLIKSTTDPDQYQSYGLLLQTIAAAAVWIPYFRVSRRVRLTFVR